MIKVSTHANLGPILYHSEPSDVPNQFLRCDSFYRLLQQHSSNRVNKNSIDILIIFQEEFDPIVHLSLSFFWKISETAKKWALVVIEKIRNSNYLIFWKF